MSSVDIRSGFTGSHGGKTECERPLNSGSGIDTVGIADEQSERIAFSQHLTCAGGVHVIMDTPQLCKLCSHIALLCDILKSVLVR